jgi:hypothetical protein
MHPITTWIVAVALIVRHCAGLLNSEDQGFGGSIVDAAYHDLLIALQKGNKQRCDLSRLCVGSTLLHQQPYSLIHFVSQQRAANELWHAL